jgi:hypothetical protein
MPYVKGSYSENINLLLMNRTTLSHCMYVLFVLNGKHYIAVGIETVELWCQQKCAI